MGSRGTIFIVWGLFLWADAHGSEARKYQIDIEFVSHRKVPFMDPKYPFGEIYSYETINSAGERVVQDIVKVPHRHERSGPPLKSAIRDDSIAVSTVIFSKNGQMKSSVQFSYRATPSGKILSAEEGCVVEQTEPGSSKYRISKDSEPAKVVDLNPSQPTYNNVYYEQEMVMRKLLELAAKYPGRGWAGAERRFVSRDELDLLSKDGETFELWKLEDCQPKFKKAYSRFKGVYVGGTQSPVFVYDSLAADEDSVERSTDSFDLSGHWVSSDSNDEHSDKKTFYYQIPFDTEVKYPVTLNFDQESPDYSLGDAKDLDSGKFKFYFLRARPAVGALNYVDDFKFSNLMRHRDQRLLPDGRILVDMSKKGDQAARDPILPEYFKLPASPKVKELSHDLRKSFINEKKFEKKIKLVTDKIEKVLTWTDSDTNLSLDEIYAVNRGTCVDFSNLAVEVFRDLGFPARVVVGSRFKGRDHKIKVGGHAWIEIHDGEKWVQVEPQNGEIVTSSPQYLPIFHAATALGYKNHPMWSVYASYGFAPYLGEAETAKPASH